MVLEGGAVDIFWIAVVVVLFVLTLALIALCDPGRGRS
jgi:hypothetical protein